MKYSRSEDTSINIMLKTHGKEIFYELMDFYEYMNKYLSII